MSKVSNDLQGWERCDSGLLVKLSSQAKSARRRRKTLQASVITLAVLIAVGFGVWSTGWRSNSREFYYGDIACHEVQENMPAMTAGTLPDELKARIEVHLRECSACQQMMQKMHASQATAGHVDERWTCDFPHCQQHYAQAAMEALNSIERQGPSWRRGRCIPPVIKTPRAEWVQTDASPNYSACTQINPATTRHTDAT